MIARVASGTIGHGIVLDCSVAAAWFFEDEGDVYARAVAAYLRDGPAYVPSLWPLELASALLNGERRKRIARKEIDRGLEQVERLDIRVVEDTISMIDLVRLASAWKLTVYDASYVQLASRLRAPLASLDRSMCDAAVRGSVDLFA